SSERKWSAVTSESGVHALGALETLRPYLDTSEAEWAEIDALTRTLTDRGLRVLLLAHHPDPAQLDPESERLAAPASMVPLGLISLSDELRPEAGRALQGFRAAGVTAKIISGDNSDTVVALAIQAGLGP